MKSPSKTPVLFIIFNRYDTASRVFETIRQYAPAKLYIAADGPRATVDTDAARCQDVREMAANVDWPCEVVTLYREENLGLKLAVSGAISWFFEQEEEGIILEDDCLPHASFFPYCQQLLDYYRHDQRITHIGGANLQFGKQRGPASYYFSNLPSVWGWAAWRRSWQHYQLNMELFPAFEKEAHLMHYVFNDTRIADFAHALSKATYEQKISTWDFPYAFATIINHGLCITPNRNLVSNIGFQAESTNTRNTNDVHANIPVESIGQLTHPLFFIPDQEADNYQLSHSLPPAKDTNLSQPSGGLFSKAQRSIRKIFNP